MICVVFNQIVTDADNTSPMVTITPGEGSYPPDQLVTITADEPAEIYYTLDGSDPTDESTLYTAPFVPGAATVKAIGIDAAGNASDVVTAIYTIALINPTSPHADWQETTTLEPPGSSGAWNAVSAPLLPAHQSLAPIYALTTYSITLNLQDITGQVERCTIEETEASAFGTCTLELPVGIDINQGDAVAVILAGVSRLYLVEDITSTGPARSVWCRSTAAVLDEPHAAEGSWNGWDTPYTTANQLGTALCGITPLTWLLPNWTLPTRWELSGTPIECLQRLVATVGGIVISNPDGSLTARRRWAVRPPDMPGATPVATISRDTALDESPLTAKATPGKGYGSITVYGYDPAADLPDMEVEETKPVHGLPVHVRLFWPNVNPPTFSSFITDGTATKLGSADYVVSAEEVLFDQGSGSTRYPIKALHSFEWVGRDQGGIWWLENGDTKELSTVTPSARGIALITYTTRYERWRLTGQTANKCLFGVDVGQGQVSAVVSYSSGGSLAPALTASLVNDAAGCIETGTAFLDSNRAVKNVSALLPLTTAQIVPGSTVLVSDTITGVVGNGKVVSTVIMLEPGRTTRQVEVQVPC